MLAFHNDPAVKAKYLARIEAHQKADEIVKGRYWSGGRGCAVGCTLHSDNHAAYESELGIPQMLARLEDGIFEGMPLADAQFFPLRFLSAIPVGANLSLIGWKFLSWSVELTLKRHGTRAVRDGCKPAVQLLRDMAGGKQIAAAAWSAAAESAARSAAWSAWSAESAAESAAWSARSAESAAAESAAWSARSARSAAESAAWSARNEQAEKLLELLAAAPVPA